MKKRLTGLTGLGIEAKHFSALQLCNPVNPANPVNPVKKKAMSSAPLRLCEKISHPVNYAKPQPD